MQFLKSAFDRYLEKIVIIYIRQKLICFLNATKDIHIIAAACADVFYGVLAATGYTQLIP